MSDVFILNDYGKLSRHNEHLVYTNYKGECRNILLCNAEMLVLSGAVTITAETFQLLSQKNVPVFMTGKGHNSSIRLDYGQGKNVFLRQQQYRIIDSEKSLEIAKAIVLGKLHNQIEFLKRQKWNRQLDQLEESVEKLKNMRQLINECSSSNQLRGCEGMAAKIYFSNFDSLFIPEWAKFGTRSKRPPLTNVNAVLSFTYSVLMMRLQRLLDALGLDTMASNLHELCYGKDTLAFDMVEEFRSPFADSLCLRLFNLNILSEKDFEERDGGVFMTKEGNAKVVNEIEEKFDSLVFYEPEQEKMKYSEVMMAQARMYKSVVMGELEQYIPFRG